LSQNSSFHLLNPLKNRFKEIINSVRRDKYLLKNTENKVARIIKNNLKWLPIKALEHQAKKEEQDVYVKKQAA
jgi:hypothetical protein